MKELGKYIKMKKLSNKFLFSLIIFVIPAIVLGITLLIPSASWNIRLIITILCASVSGFGLGSLFIRYYFNK